MMGCSFCSQRLFWRGDWRAREPENVVAEMRHPGREVRCRVHHAHRRVPDARPASAGRRSSTCSSRRTSGHDLLIETRVEDIIRDEAILWKYAEAGIIHVYMGAETSTDEMLSSLNKGTTIDQNKQAIDSPRPTTSWSRHRS